MNIFFREEKMPILNMKIKIKCIIIVRTSFGLYPKTDPNNEFIERGRKKQLDFRNEVMIMGGLEEKLRVQYIKIVIDVT